MKNGLYPSPNITDYGLCIVLFAYLLRQADKVE